jgi:diguanylate cyclase (GGDEF)-like protein
MGENHLRLISTMTNHLALALKNATEHQKIQELAVTDELTGLYNRRAFQHALDKELRRSKRYQKSLSLIMLDIDGFKEINDTFGHQAGDEVLKTLAAYLRSGVRDTDLIARYGGDEFAIILPETKAHEAAVLAERLKNSISHHSVTTEETPHPIIADISNNGMSSDELIRRADHVLYRSKGDGGDAVKILSDT